MSTDSTRSSSSTTVLSRENLARLEDDTAAVQTPSWRQRANFDSSVSIEFTAAEAAQLLNPTVGGVSKQNDAAGAPPKTDADSDDSNTTKDAIDENASVVSNVSPPLDNHEQQQQLQQHHQQQQQTVSLVHFDERARSASDDNHLHHYHDLSRRQSLYSTSTPSQDALHHGLSAAARGSHWVMAIDDERRPSIMHDDVDQQLVNVRAHHSLTDVVAVTVMPLVFLLVVVGCFVTKMID